MFLRSEFIGESSSAVTVADLDILLAGYGNLAYEADASRGNHQKIVNMVMGVEFYLSMLDIDLPCRRPYFAARDICAVWEKVMPASKPPPVPYGWPLLWNLRKKCIFATVESLPLDLVSF